MRRTCRTEQLIDCPDGLAPIWQCDEAIRHRRPHAVTALPLRPRAASAHDAFTITIGPARDEPYPAQPRLFAISSEVTLRDVIRSNNQREIKLELRSNITPGQFDNLLKSGALGSPFSEATRWLKFVELPPGQRSDPHAKMALPVASAIAQDRPAAERFAAD